MERNFMQLLKARHDKGLRVCVGLDPVLDKIPEHITRGAGGPARAFQFFCCEIVDATKDYALAYKPNSAFFEALGPDGIHALRAVIAYIKKVAPEVPVIYDAKRADIGTSNLGYVKSAFDFLGADAITVHPYMGKESLEVFFSYGNKGIFVLCRTSNPGAGEFQDLEIIGSDRPLYQYVAAHVANKWNYNRNCALVIGATAPEELAKVRRIIGPDMPILIPGIGAQGGDIEKTVKAGGSNIIVNLSRSVLYASSGEDFAEAARKEVLRVTEEIQKYL